MLLRGLSRNDARMIVAFSCSRNSRGGQDACRAWNIEWQAGHDEVANIWRSVALAQFGCACTGEAGP